MVRALGQLKATVPAAPCWRIDLHQQALQQSVKKSPVELFKTAKHAEIIEAKK
jgi:hypothetical protein